MSVGMRKSQNKVLQFPTPPKEPVAAPIVTQIGIGRFAIHWDMEDLLASCPREREGKLLAWPARPPVQRKM